MGLELANQFLEKGNPAPLYLESSARILDLAKRQTSDAIGELLVAVLANMIQHPTEEQSKILANWARAYIGECVMNLDPALREFQETKLINKTFILDTDFALRCIIKEHPSHKLDLTLLERLNDLGCRLIIPPAVVKECVTHVTLALSNYSKFKGISLMGLTPEFVYTKVNNIFVQGYYYGIKGLVIPPKWTFQDYLDNYYDAEDPTRFFNNVMEGILPPKVETIDPESLLVKGPPDPSMIEEVRTELLKLLEKSPKSESRTAEQRQQLALTDARIFVAALQLNSEHEDQTKGCILGRACYVITDSGRYLRAAKELKIRDVVTTRPQQLVTLFELMAGPMADDAAIVQLFDNPMLYHAVEEVWDDVRILLNNGIGLSGKSLARLRWDLDIKLHERISALKLAEERAEEEGASVDIDGGDREYVQLLEDATSLGYPSHKLLESLNEALAQAKNDAETQRISKEQLQEKLDLFSTEIDHFGKKKQRYLRRIMKK